MPDCEICGGPCINGRPIRIDDETGVWRIDHDYSPMDPNSLRVCRDCAKQRVGVEA
jgi:hypothetical protein